MAASAPACDAAAMIRIAVAPRIALALLSAGALLVAGCAATPSASPTPSPTPAATPAASPTPSGSTTPVAEIHRSSACSCCGEYEAYLRSHGWTVSRVDESDMAAFKTSLGLPPETWSCHTTLIEGYVVEGHVPLEAIEELLTERPPIEGIALPGMPPGSPGMAGEKEGPFVVLAIDDGEVSTFGSY